MLIKRRESNTVNV